MAIVSALYRQFSRPQGFLGHVAGWIMANRPSNLERNRWTVDLLEVRPDDRVLEIGFGPGLSLSYVWNRIASGRGSVVGLDHSQAMMVQASRRNRVALKSSRMTLVHGGLDQLGRVEGAFEKVFSVNVLHFLRDRPSVLRDIQSRITPGGTLATTHQPRHHGARPEDAAAFGEGLAMAMREAGFLKVRTESLPLKPIPVVCVLGETENE